MQQQLTHKQIGCTVSISYKVYDYDNTHYLPLCKFFFYMLKPTVEALLAQQLYSHSFTTFSDCCSVLFQHEDGSQMRYFTEQCRYVFMLLTAEGNLLTLIKMQEKRQPVRHMIKKITAAFTFSFRLLQTYLYLYCSWLDKLWRIS